MNGRKRRAPLVIGNWKMHKSPREAAAFAAEYLVVSPDLPEEVNVAIAPSFPALERLGRSLAFTSTLLAAQDVHPESRGAFTGGVSAAMLSDLGVALALVGHSERRRLCHEDEPILEQKIRRLVEVRIAPVYCVGETLAEREAGLEERVLASQMAALDSFGQVPPSGLSLAYEPVWAIGTGRSATPEIANAAHALLRSFLAERFGPESAEEIRILYGGSVTAETAPGLFAQEQIDGALVGGASLSVPEFTSIVRSAR